MRPLHEYRVEGEAGIDSTEYRVSLRRALGETLDSIAGGGHSLLEGRALLHRGISRRPRGEVVGEIRCTPPGGPGWLLEEVRDAVKRMGRRVVVQRWRPRDRTRRVFYVEGEGGWRRVVAEPSGYTLIATTHKTGLANLVIEVAGTVDSVPEHCATAYMLAHYLHNMRPAYMLIATPPAIYTLALHPDTATWCLLTPMRTTT